MAVDEVRNVLEKLGKPHLFEGVKSISAEESRSFLAQLKSYPPSLPRQQKELLSSGKKPMVEGIIPCTHFDRVGNSDDAQRGQELVRQGKVGCLVLAGGQGTRLGHEGPKGAVCVSAIQKKSLFQLICEKTKGASAKPLPLCFMTSPLNHKQTVAFFEAHHFFGLASSQLSFFQQQMLPFTDDRGEWLLEKPGVIAEGPDGNGHALRLFFETGLWKQWKSAGIEYLNVIFVDNALADPFDAEFVGFTARKQVDAALKAIERQGGEKMGVLAQHEETLQVIEYSELPADNARYALSSTGMFCLSMEFIGRLCGEGARDFPCTSPAKRQKFLPARRRSGSTSASFSTFSMRPPPAPFWCVLARGFTPR